ncbi:MAG: heparinase II/III family protein, partial [Parvibaculum sp.]
LLRDGPQGEEGALAILRSGPEQDAAAVVFKATSQGMGHGHLDRLGLLYFDNGDEVVADYGAARFLNVEPKDGGRYLPENESWAQQTVAHNTLVVDQASQFGGDWRAGEEHSPRILAFAVEGDVQYTAAEIESAYAGVVLQRLIGLVADVDGDSYVVDIVRARSRTRHSYDLPVHFKGQLIDTSFDMKMATQTRSPLGSAFGYQHLWMQGESGPIDGMSKLSWLLGDQFYTLTFKTSAPVTAIMTELGANDPNDNLRNEQALLLRTTDRSIDYVSVYERHGRYDNDEEVTVFDGGSVVSITDKRVGDVVIYSISVQGGRLLRAFFADNTDLALNHCIEVDGQAVTWRGAVKLSVRSETASTSTRKIEEEVCRDGSH